jgi:hypothetical protein
VLWGLNASRCSAQVRRREVGSGRWQGSPIGGPRFSGTDDGGAGLALHTSPHTTVALRPTNATTLKFTFFAHRNHTMRWLFSSALVLAWSAVVAAKSSTGNRLLVVLEEQSEKEKYSVFLEDLSCKLLFYSDEMRECACVACRRVVVSIDRPWWCPELEAT